MKRMMNQMMKKTIFTLAIFFVCIASIPVSAQQLTQTIRGTVTDKVSQSPMPGAVVTIVNSNPAIGTATDVNGNFVLNKVPVGRQSIKVTFMGYKETTMPNVIVNSGKEVVLNIQMEEDVVQGKEVVVTGQVVKNKPLNEMATVSTRTFSVEETQKFAAAVNDPSRMALAFAGVVSGPDGSNIISIRGNSPNGLLWRMEGVDIPNPNHFSSVGTSGGGISILSAQLLSNSDFMTGAFASEYGNALSGVFDLKLRKGNNQKREYTFQAGVLGIDVATEGPFKKGYGGSYLVNYRYSTLSLLGLMGVDVGDATTNFQDLSFNVSLPTTKYGTFGVFGFGGLSSQRTNAEKDSSIWKEESFKRYPSMFVANTGTFGVNNIRLFGRQTVLKSTLLASGTKNAYKQEKYDYSYNLGIDEDNSYTQGRVALSSTLTHKFNAKNSLRAGFILSSLHYSFIQKEHDDSLNTLATRINNSGSTATVQAFAQWQHRITEKLSTNAGAHVLWLALNNTYSVEPRASVKYDINSGQNISLGYGLHGQIQPLGVYFGRNANNELMNRNLAMSKAHHLVLSYDIQVTSHTHVKTEVYYQHLYDIPVGIDAGSRYSAINLIDGFNAEAMNSKGIGRNYGVELTVERFLHRNFYYLLSASLYDSKYKAADGNWYNTRFNTNYATSFTAGKEWQLSEKRKRKVLGINTRVMYSGGFRNTPIDLNASVAKGAVVYDEAKSFTVKNSDYVRIDVRFSIKRNFAKSTSTLSLDLQNATNHQNIGGQYFDETTLSIKNWYQNGILPVLAYRLEF